MSKVTRYLNEHILGEVIANKAIREQFSTDASVLTITPEMIVYPRVTNDIRKVARFAWQLAEKGHVLPLTARGGGSDQTGAAIGKGAIISTPTHLNAIFELDDKQKLIRLQPGVLFKTLNDTLSLHGLRVPSYPVSAAYSTIGGAVANNASGELSGFYGATDQWVHQLEVVLANGDVLQTSRLSKRELNHRKGLQTFEGEIYRKIDGIIMDNLGTVESIAPDKRDNIGYSGIVRVKQKDGSFDLTPLFLGSQGTLGIISELIIKSDFFSVEQHVVVAAFETYQSARDAVEGVAKQEPALFDIIDGELFTEAAESGKKYRFYEDIVATGGSVGAVIVVAFDEFNGHVRSKKVKHVAKNLRALGASVVIGSSPDEVRDLLAIRDVVAFTTLPDDSDISAPPIITGAYVPRDRFEDFTVAVADLAAKQHLKLPISGRVNDSVWYIRPQLQLKKVGDKQKIFKLLDEYATLVSAHGGYLIGQAGEGRLKASFALKQIDEAERKLYEEIKAVFDPHGILNPGVKQDSQLKDLVPYLRSEYSVGTSADYLPDMHS